jgi:hypothetical protein
MNRGGYKSDCLTKMQLTTVGETQAEQNLSKNSGAAPVEEL